MIKREGEEHSPLLLTLIHLIIMPITREAILSRQSDGHYMLTSKPVVRAEVEGQGRDDLYILPGEPIGFRNMCKGFWKSMGIELPRFSSVKIRMTVEVVEEVK